MRCRVVAVIALNFAISVGTAATLAWVLLEPRYWFEGAYAEKGPPGDPGPRGPRGPVGPPRPVGPSAEEAVAALESDVEEVASAVDDVTARADDVEGTVDDVDSTVARLCDAIELNYFYANSATEALRTDLDDAC